MRKEMLRIRRRCPAATNLHGPCPFDCGCRGTGTVETDTDNTGKEYLGGAQSLPMFMVRLQTLMAQELKDEGRAILLGLTDDAIIHAARRSALAEVYVGLEGYLAGIPVREARVHQAHPAYRRRA